MTMSKRNIQISLPCTGEEEWQAIREPLTTGWLTQGPKVQEFENLFSKTHELNHSLATTSCTTGLHLILAAMGIGPGDEVIVPAFTWVATANVVLYCGATPIFADIDPVTFNIDPKSVQAKINKNTKAIIAVHLFGLSADMDALKQVAGGLPIIEDAACAAGSTYKGQFVGAIGLAAAFSFHPRKSVTTGEGGMVTTNDKQLFETMSILRSHGASISEEMRHRGATPYLLPDFNLLGFNYRMTDIQAAMGIVQLKKLNTFIEERQKWAEYYFENLKTIPWLRLPQVPEGYRHGWQSFVTWVDEKKSPMKRNDLMSHLQQLGIATRPGTHAPHMLGLYVNKYGLKPEDCPNSRDAYNNSMSIPLHNKMTKEDFDYVIHALKSV